MHDTIPQNIADTILRCSRIVARRYATSQQDIDDLAAVLCVRACVAWQNMPAEDRERRCLPQFFRMTRNHAFMYQSLKQMHGSESPASELQIERLDHTKTPEDLFFAAELRSLCADYQQRSVYLQQVLQEQPICGTERYRYRTSALAKKVRQDLAPYAGG